MSDSRPVDGADDDRAATTATGSTGDPAEPVTPVTPASTAPASSGPASTASPAPASPVAEPRGPAALLLPALLAVTAMFDLAGLGLDLAPSGAGALAAVLDGAAAALALAVAVAVVISVARPPARLRRALVVSVLSGAAAVALALSATASAVRAASTGSPVHLAGVVVAVLAVAAVPVPWAAATAGAAVQVPFVVAVALHRGPGAEQLVLLVALDAAVLAAAALYRRRIDALRSEADAIRADAQRQAVLDPLTGAGNRRGLDILALPMIEHARRKGEAVHCLYLDLDGFRQVNEDLGRAEGDALLVGVYEAVAASVRTTDVVARLDADRFVVLGPGTGTSPLEMERRVRGQLEDHPPVSADVWEVGVSIGSATLVPWDEGGVDVLLRRAEEDMRLRRSLRRQSRMRSRGAQPPVPPGVPGVPTER